MVRAEGTRGFHRETFVLPSPLWRYRLKKKEERGNLLLSPALFFPFADFSPHWVLFWCLKILSSSLVLEIFYKPQISPQFSLQMKPMCLEDPLSKRLLWHGQGSHHLGSGNRPWGSTMFSEHCQEPLEASPSQGTDSLWGLGEWMEHMLTVYEGENNLLHSSTAVGLVWPTLDEWKLVTNAELLLWAGLWQRSRKVLEWTEQCVREVKTSLAEVPKMLLFLLSPSLSSDSYF